MAFKYESDMTKKDKRKAEIDKLKRLPWPEKFGHMWTYHKPIVLAPLVLLLLFLGTRSFVENLRYQEVLNIAVADSTFLGDGIERNNMVKELIGVTNPYANVFVDHNYFFQNLTNQDTIQRFVVKASAQAIDLFVSDYMIYSHYNSNAFFMDLGEIFSDNELAQLTVINNNAIDLAEYTYYVENLFGVRYDPVLLTVIDNVILDEVSLEAYVKRDTIRNFVFGMTGITPD